MIEAIGLIVVALFLIGLGAYMNQSRIEDREEQARWREEWLAERRRQEQSGE